MGGSAPAASVLISRLILSGRILTALHLLSLILNSLWRHQGHLRVFSLTRGRFSSSKKRRPWQAAAAMETWFPAAASCSH